MENKMEHISENELEGLLNQAFLNLDFKNARNSEVLEIVGNYNMRKNFLARLFNPHRLNLLFLILPAFIFLNSFYRYLEPIINKDNKKYGPVLGISPVNVSEQPEVKREVIETRTGVERKTKDVRVENKSKPKHKRGGTVIKPTIPVKIEKADSIFLSSLASVEVDTVRALSRPETDLTHLTQKSNPAKVVAANKKIRPERKVTQKLSSKNGKTPKMRGASRFRKNGTFILKGGRYGKSRRIQR